MVHQSVTYQINSRGIAKHIIVNKRLHVSLFVCVMCKSHVHHFARDEIQPRIVGLESMAVY